MIDRRVAVLAAALIAAGCGGGARSAAPGGAVGDAAYREAARARLAREGLEPGRVWVVSGAAWRAAAAGVGTLAAALGRADLPGVSIEPRGGSVCARSSASVDCMFVSVVGTDDAPHDVDLARVEAVVVVEPLPPDDDTRMAWREELRTGRLLLFVGAPRGRAAPSRSALGAGGRRGVY